MHRFCQRQASRGRIDFSFVSRKMGKVIKKKRCSYTSQSINYVQAIRLERLEFWCRRLLVAFYLVTVLSSTVLAKFFLADPFWEYILLANVLWGVVVLQALHALRGLFDAWRFRQQHANAMRDEKP